MGNSRWKYRYIIITEKSRGLRHTLVLSLQSKMKDAQGFWRGRCSKAECQCSCFMSEDAACSACDYCEHPPSDHVVLGPCTSCLGNDCGDYVEDEGDEGRCSYCGCTPADHELPHCKLPGCKKPRLVEGQRIHDFCGRSHARQYMIQEQGEQSLCTFPNCLRPRYQEPSGHVHDFCGRSHAQQYSSMMQRGMLPTTSTPVSMVTNVGGGGGGGGPHCKFPGCAKPCYREPSGCVHEFCGRTHAQQYMAMHQGGGLPRPQSAATLGRNPAACLVMDNNSEIVRAFLEKWTKNPERKPQRTDIKGVFRIDNPTLKSRFDQYCANLSSPNVSWHYHGTSIKCYLLQSGTFCSDTNCGICGISGVGFDKARIGTHVRFQRFGKAFCLAPNSSKCHEYTLGIGGYRALLYCQVALGNPYYTTCDMEGYQSPPPGYDSVYGKVGTHRSSKGTLNYDEVAIYGVSEAILPKYIIVYQKDDIQGLLR